MFRRYRTGIGGFFLVMPLRLSLVAATVGDRTVRVKAPPDLSPSVSAPESHEDKVGKNLEARGAEFRLATVGIGSAGGSLVILLVLKIILSLLGTWLLFHLLLRRRSSQIELLLHLRQYQRHKHRRGDIL